MGRFYTSDDQFVGLTKLPNAAVSLAQACIRKVTGRIPRQPWIPFSAARKLDAVILPTWKVWEVGAGKSTLWLSERAGHITSIEAAEEWFNQLSEAIERENIHNVDLRYQWRGSKMSSFSDAENGSLDLLFIDGGPRAECLHNGFRKVRSGGYIYLDNWENLDYWRGSREFLKSRSEDIAETTPYVDYVPGQVGVYRGLMIRKV